MLTSYHESGHGVLAHNLGYTFDDLSIASNAADCGWAEGAGAYGPGYDYQRLIFVTGGPIAQCMASGVSEFGEAAAHEAAHVIRAARLPLKHIGDAAKDAHHLLREHWMAVESVAEALRSEWRIDGDDAARLIEKAQRRPVYLVLSQNRTRATAED